MNKRSFVAAFIDDGGRVLVAWVIGLAIEHVIVGIARRDELAGAWELWPARTAAAPIFLGCALFAAIACVGFTRVVWHEAEAPKSTLVGVLGFVLGWGVGTGRHFASPLPHLLLAATTACAAIGVLYMYLAARARRPAAMPLALVVLAALAWWADGHVLVRLYPAFHAALFAVALAASGMAVLEPCLFGKRVTRGALIVAAACALYSPLAARRLRGYDNLRRVLVEAAPWMGRAVEVAAVIAPREPDDDGGTLTSAPAEAKPALDWSGRDIVLVSIDALRADHVGAYGYARKTTPHIDALAKEGTLFRHAYCPTPHTSYSITSMMTGKYVRPLLALGLGADSETLASHLRRYGYRTAAFYPPAVFFIDESKFQTFEDRALDFEYRKVEFADPALRETQLRAYLETADGSSKPLFLWVHYFEPHEPYVQHAAHHFGETEADAYDSEIAEADDGVGRVVAAVREKRPNAIVIVTADHGEEFGDHGGRYHGTTVYEEQVRVPLLVTGAGVRAGAEVDVPVQTIDLVPTVLSALGIPRPARVRGRDVGGLLAGDAKKDDAGFAFAETDDYALLAKSSLRLVCEKRVDACALYDVAHDAAEKHDVSASHGADVTAMRSELAAVERSHGRFEGQGAALPDALRRGAAGDVTAAEEVAGLLDDVNVEYRREAARVLFDLGSDKPAAQMRRARDKDDDPIVRGTCAAALVRVDKAEDTAPAVALLQSEDVDLRRRAALALAERGDASGAKELGTWLETPGVEFARQREIVAALAASKARAQAPTLITLLDDVRLRGYVAEALGKLGDVSAKPALLAHFSAEPYAPVRAREAEALIALGATREIATALARYAGMPEPLPGALELADKAGLLEKNETLRAPVDGPLRLGVLLEKPGVTLEIDGATVPTTDGVETWVDVPTHGPTLTVKATPREGAVRGFWVVAKSSELD